jgi:glycosyltransferase involved in cell wall biosynthesis
MRILLGSDTYLPDCNGAAYFTQRLGLGLQERGHEIHVVAPSLSLAHGTEVRDGMPVTRLRSFPVPTYPALRFAPRPPHNDRRLDEVIRRIQPDIVHVQNHFFVSRALLRSARRVGVTGVATNHFVPENIGVQFATWPGPIRNGIVNWMGRDLVKVYEDADAVATPTPIAASLLEARGTRHHVLPISNGIDLRLYPATVSTQAEARARFGLADRPTVLFVGRLDLEKNLEDLIRGFAILRRDTDAQLVLAGKGKEQPHLEELARAEGIAKDVVFPGFIPDEDLPHVYRVGDVFCMPGIAELQSIVTLEAMASRLPVVAANAMALPHLAQDGVNGYLYEPGQPDQLAARLLDILASDDRRAEMGDRSRELVEEHDVERSLDAYEAFYRDALERRAASGAEEPAMATDPAPGGRAASAA